MYEVFVKFFDPTLRFLDVQAGTIEAELVKIMFGWSCFFYVLIFFTFVWLMYRVFRNFWKP